MADTKEPAGPRIYEFDRFRLDARRRLLQDSDGRSIDLSTKSFDVLVYFLEHPGTVIDRATLLDAVWPQTVVDENNLNQAVAALRRALGRQSILTVPRQGYQFPHDVRRRDAVDERETRTVVGLGAAGGDHRLSRVAGLPRKLVVPVASIAASLLVAISIPVAIRFLEGRTETSTTSGRDPLLFGGTALDPPPTASTEALAALLRAESIAMADEAAEAATWDEVVDLLNRAIESDSRFALAYARRASANMARARASLLDSYSADIGDYVALARDDVEKALELDPNLGSAYIWQGVLSLQRGEPREARDAFKMALDLSPDDPQVIGNSSLYLVIAGRPDEALQLLGRFDSITLPRAFDSTFFYYAGDLDRAAERASQVVNQDPDSVPFRFELGYFEALRGNRQAASYQLALVEEFSKQKGLTPRMLASLTYAYGRIGLDEEATRVFEMMREAVPDQETLNPICWMLANLGIGETERALAWAERAASRPFLLFPLPELEFVVNSMKDPILERADFAALRRPGLLVALSRQPGLLD